MSHGPVAGRHPGGAYAAKQHDIGFMSMKPSAGGMIRDARLAIKYLLQFDDVVPIPRIEKASEIEETPASCDPQADNLSRAPERVQQDDGDGARDS